jgi:hypothetical protein
VSLPAVPPEIILPRHWLPILVAILDSTNPVDGAISMYGFDMTLQDVVPSEAPLANATTLARGAILLEACRSFGRGRTVRLLLNFLPRVGRVWYGRVREIVGVKTVVTQKIVLLSSRRNS